MLDTYRMFQNALRRKGMSMNAGFPQITGQYSTALYRALRNPHIKVSTLEQYVHFLGCRLRITIENPDGTILETTVSDPSNPIITEEDIKRKEAFKEKNAQVRAAAIENLHTRRKEKRLERAKHAYKTGKTATDK